MGGRGIGCIGLLKVEVWITFTPQGSRRLQTTRPELDPDPDIENDLKLELELDPDPELELELDP